MDADRDIVLTRDQVRLVDQLAVSEYLIPSIVLMENAGRNAADWIAANFTDTKRAAILCGSGNNGGDGFVIARHLANVGWSVRIGLLGESAKLCGDARINHDIAAAMQIPMTTITSDTDAADFAAGVTPRTVVVDALLGTGFSGAVREPMATLIRRINETDSAGVVAIDVPSGLDCDTGSIENVAVRAGATITFVAAKPGMILPSARMYVGKIVVRDIGAPPALIDRVRRIPDNNE